MHEAEIAHALDKIWNKSSERNWIPARLGRGETGEEIEVPGRAGYVYVRTGEEGDGGVTIARDRVGVAPVGLQKLQLRREVGELVIRAATVTASAGGGGGGDTVQTFQLTFSTSTTEPPASTQIRLNNSAQDAATVMWLSGTSDSGADILNHYRLIEAGDKLYVQDYNDSSKYQIYAVTAAPTIETDYVEIPVMWEQGGTALANNQQCLVSLKGSGSGGGGGMEVHSLDGAYHSGTLSWVKVNKTGSNFSDLQNRTHLLVGPDHSASGLTAGWTIRASGPSTFAWAELQHTDLGNILPDQHHFRAHDIINGDEDGAVHTALAPAFSIVGTVALNTLGYLTATHDPGATERLLKTSSDGSLFLDTNLLYVDALQNRVGINRIPSTPGGGAAALDVISATTGDHTMRVKRIDNQEGRMWRVEDSNGDELIVLDSVGNLQSGRPGYVSGLRGWQITPGGNAEFNNIWARGELHATVFVKDEVHAVGGSLLVATAATVRTEVAIDSAATDVDEFRVDSAATAFPGEEELPLTIETTSVLFSGTTLFVEAIGNVIEIDNPPSGPGLYFTPGEIIRVKTEVPTGVNDMWFVVKNVTQAEGYNRVSVYKTSGTDGVIPKGAALVSYGHPGDGRILMTSDWRIDDGYPPYIDVFTTGAAPWDDEDPTGIIPRMRMGQLKGVGVTGVSGISQYGLIAGSDLSNANSGYLVASNLGIKLYKVPIWLNDGSNNTGLWTPEGKMYIGRNIGNPTLPGGALPATTGFTVDTSTGDVLIGDVERDNFIRWSHGSGILTVKGTLVVDDPGTTVTLDYVDDQDQYYNGLAIGYGSTAETNAKNHINSRRLLKVEGTFTPTDNNVSWAGVTLYLADNSGTTRLIYDGSVTASLGTAINTRTYLYANITAVGTSYMQVFTTQNVTNANLVLVAVCDPGRNGTNKASVQVVAGSTFISGGNIVTQSIVSQTIAAGAIVTDHMTANTINGDRITFRTLAGDKITTTTLSAIQASTGVLTVNSNGYIHSAGKTYYGSNTAGFFMGYSGADYKFDIGNDQYYLRWDGDDLYFQTRQPINFRPAAGITVMTFSGTSGQGYASMYLEGVDPDPILRFSSIFRAEKYLSSPRLEISDTLGSAGIREVIGFTANGVRRVLTHDAIAGLLTYSNTLAAAGSLVGGLVVSTGNTVRIEDRSDVSTSTPFGTAGDIRWGWHDASSTWCLFVFCPTAPSGANPGPGWFRVGLVRV